MPNVITHSLKDRKDEPVQFAAVLIKSTPEEKSETSHIHLQRAYDRREQERYSFSHFFDKSPDRPALLAKIWKHGKEHNFNKDQSEIHFFPLYENDVRDTFSSLELIQTFLENARDYVETRESYNPPEVENKPIQNFSRLLSLLRSLPPVSETPAEAKGPAEAEAPAAGQPSRAPASQADPFSYFTHSLPEPFHRRISNNSPMFFSHLTITVKVQTIEATIIQGENSSPDTESPKSPGKTF